MVVYDYPLFGAMTVVKDKATGDEHRIFVDVYTLEVVPDKPATETERGIWSIYEQRLKNGIDENLKAWQESDNLTKFIERKTTSMEINISAPVTDEQMKKLSGDATIKATATTKTLNVPLYGQTTNYYCAPASAQMIAAYYGVSHSQDYIYGIMGGVAPNGVDLNRQLTYYKSSQGLAKTNSVKDYDLYFNEAVTEINNNRPYVSGLTGHARACVGYYYAPGDQVLAINDPSPMWSGEYLLESFGSEVDRIYVRS